MPLYAARRSTWATGPATASIPASRWSGSIGGACAIGAAYQAKFHRLAALILMGGAGLVTCITFVWLSAPDLALTQLLVEVVTTVDPARPALAAQAHREILTQRT